MREAGISRKDPRLAWVEWSVAEVGDIYDRHRVAATNPALGIRLQMSVIDDELGQMTPEGYARERLGWWSDYGSTPPAIAKPLWDACKVDAAPKGGRPAFGVKFSIDGDRVSFRKCRFLGFQALALMDVITPQNAIRSLARK